MGFLFFLAVGVAFYVFYCFCLKVICEKCGKDPGILVWIPILNLIPIIELAGMPVWVILLFMVPLVNVVLNVLIWANICKARGKSPVLVVMMFIPLANIAFIPYLAFAD